MVSVVRVTRVRQGLVARSLCAALFFSSAEAFAQDEASGLQGDSAKSAEPPIHATTAEIAKPPSNDAAAASNDAAALAYRLALAAYASGDVQGALKNMQQSYALSGRAELLFNLARLEDELQQCQAALRDYDGYLRRVPNGKLLSEARWAVHELQRECPADPTPKAEPTKTEIRLPEAPPPRLSTPPSQAVPVALPAARRTSVTSGADASYWSASRVVGWSAIASGVFSGGLALAFFKAALDDHDAAVKIAATYRYAPKDPPWVDEQQAQHRNLQAARILGISAGALVAGGVVVLILSPKPGSAVNAGAALALRPDYLGAVCAGSF